MISGTEKFSQTASGTPVAKAIKTGVSGKRIFVTDIAGSSDKAGSYLKVIEDTSGTPITKFQVQLGADVNFSHSFITPIQIAVGKSASVEVDGTNLASANIAGFITDN